MTRLLAFGDVHLGAGSDYGREPTGKDSRLADQERVLNRIADLAYAQNVDAILCAGDVFHRRRPSPPEMLVWRNFLDNVKGIPLVGIAGNHDVAAYDEVTAAEVLDPIGIVRRPLIVSVAGVAVACLPWTPSSALIAARNGHAPDDVNREAVDLLLRSAGYLREHEEHRGRPMILLAHWSVSGSSTPSGLDVGTLREPVLPLEDLERLDFEAVVVGHIHKPQAFSAACPIFYTGSPCVVDFGEAATPHGVWIYDTANHAAPHKFVPIEDRPFVTLDYNGEIGDVPYYDVRDAVVRVRYKATPEQAQRIDHDRLKQALLDTGAWKVHSIQAEIERPERARVDGVDETAAPLDALGLYIEHHRELAVGTAGEMYARTRTYLEEGVAA